MSLKYFVPSSPSLPHGLLASAPMANKGSRVLDDLRHKGQTNSKQRRSQREEISKLTVDVINFNHLIITII
jgi:hypothetical protein